MVRSKIPDIGTTIFAIMSKMAEQYNAINLSRGFPDFNCDDRLIDLVTRYMKEGNNQYAPIEGIYELREVIAELVKRNYTYYYNPENEITITAGATQAISTVITALIREDDEVIVFEPAYDCYVPAIEMNGGIPIFASLKYPDYKIDWDEVQKMVNPKTKMIIINNPHNPSGTILNAQDLEKLKKIISGTNILILSDEVYENIVFDGYEHQSIARFPQLAERSIIVSSFGKSLHITGWRLGYCLAPLPIMKEIRRVHQYLTYTVNTPMQYAIKDYIIEKNYNLSLNNFYQAKRDLFAKLIQNSRFKLIPSAGTYFQLLEYSEISDEKDTLFAELLIKNHGIASIPMSVFYKDKYDAKVLRFCFAKKEETLEKAASILNQL